MRTPLCPCDSGKPYASCCHPLHAGVAAVTAEQLMRSRYSAYVVGDRDYLLATWHATTRPQMLTLDDAQTTRWLGLSVKRHVETGPDHAVVEFVARYRSGGAPAIRLHEVSRFIRDHGRWYYVDGEFPAR
ncbi:MAG: SEC-C domain-containing protein [Luteimonas sp.]|nr:SEC-C domain-containing protein [Luteimonas sp.]